MAIINALGIGLSISATPNSWLTATKGTTLYGTAGADFLSASNGLASLAGGAGDDTYCIWNATSRITELANGGIDTVQSYAAAFVLPDFLENLQLMRTGISGRGNALDNIIAGGDGSQTLDGGGGNDVLTGGAGADTFVVRRGNGSDVITDFQAGTDKVLLQDYALYGFTAVKAALSQAGADTVLNLGGGERLVLRNIKAGALTEQDFLLPADPQHAGMHMTFVEEFNSLSASASGGGTTWKTTYKIADQLRTLSSNKEAEYYSDASVGVNPFSISNGILDITAAPGSNPLHLAYNSGLLTTAQSFSQQYGYFEMRAQLPAGQGFWPAFWLLPTNGTWPPEIDILEMLGKDPTTAYFSLHSTTSPTTTVGVSLLPDLSKSFHTFALDWQADRMRWYVDGNQVAEAVTPADMHRPMYILLNLAVGDTGSWVGKYDPALPTAHMLVDYVHVWQTGTIPPAPNISFSSDPLFDPIFYAKNNPDVYAANYVSMDHYERYGWHEGRDPDAYFSTSYYLAHNLDVAAAGVNPLMHYKEYGWKEGRNPSSAFDTHLYLSHNTDVASFNFNPLEHFLSYGNQEGRMAYAVIA